MFRLTRLRIDRFRNVRPGTELQFGPGFNVALGKNATGKTTLLDLVAAIVGDDLSAYAAERDGYDLTWTLDASSPLATAIRELKVHATRTRKPSPSGAADAGDVASKPEFDDALHLELTVDAGRATLHVDGLQGRWRFAERDSSFPLSAGLDGTRPVRRALMATFQQEASKEGGLLQGAMIFAVAAFPSQRFDEALGAFDRVTRASLIAATSPSRQMPPLGPWWPFGVTMHGGPSLPPLDASMRLEESTALAHAPRLLGFVGAVVTPRLHRKSVEGDSVFLEYEGLECIFTRADGSQVRHDLLSFGQKRMFAFLWYLAIRGKEPVVADELMNGLHYEWIEAALERMRFQQSFLATQHPLLLDHLPIESAASAREMFVRCAVYKDSRDRTELVWRNFTADESERFFTAYQTGIQHVSEVLRTEGLW